MYVQRKGVIGIVWSRDHYVKWVGLGPVWEAAGGGEGAERGFIEMKRSWDNIIFQSEDKGKEKRCRQEWENHVNSKWGNLGAKGKKVAWDQKNWNVEWRFARNPWGGDASFLLNGLTGGSRSIAPLLGGAGHNDLAVSREEKHVLGLDCPDNCLSPPLFLLGVCQQAESWERGWKKVVCERNKPL